MKRREIFILAAAVLATAAFVSGCSGKSGESDAPKVSLETIVAPVQEAVDDNTEAPIQLLSLENPIDFSYSNYDTDMIFEKKDGKWLDGMDSAIPINQERFQAMADNFLHLSAVSKVENPGTLEDYEMNYPPYSLYITDSEKGPAEILIGRQDENGNYYATLDEENFYILKKSTVESLIFNYDSLVVKESLDINVTADNIKKAVVTKDGKSTTYKTSNKDAMTKIAAGLSSLKPSNFISYHATEGELASYGLDEKNRTTFLAEIDNGGQIQSVMVHVGNNADVESKFYYVLLDGSQMISVVEVETLNNLLNTTLGGEE